MCPATHVDIVLQTTVSELSSEAPLPAEFIKRLSELLSKTLASPTATPPGVAATSHALVLPPVALAIRIILDLISSGLAHEETAQQQQDLHSSTDAANRFSQLQTCLAKLYVESEKLKKKAQNLNAQVDVFLLGFSSAVHPSGQPPSILPSHFLGVGSVRNLALGGTFDHLHAGHKILLTMAACLATERVIVGITGDPLLTNKQYFEYLEPISKRIEAVTSFLKAVGPQRLACETHVLKDTCGPTATDADIQAILVSKETVPGVHYVNQARQQNHLPLLKVLVIDVISGSETNLKPEDLVELKLSSTEIRRALKNQAESFTS